MKYFGLFLVLIAFSCNEQKEDDANSESSNDEVVMTDPDVPKKQEPDRTAYIDEQIAADVTLSEANATESAEKTFVIVESGRYQIQKYQGTLMKASGHAEGFSLKFEPYDYYDYALETTVESPYEAAINVVLTKEQNKVLGYVDYSSATKNLAWDYFENLFTLYYYSDGENNYPLKFINEGKTEWDG